MSGDARTCSECGGSFAPDGARRVDGRWVCLRCLYGDAEPLAVYPIGVVRSGRRRARKGFGTRGGGELAEVRLYPGQARFMTGVAEESHLTILWRLHQARPARTVFARGWDGKRVGPFASRTPDRLTPIAVSDVELVEVRGTTLVVRGLDAVDGTPVLDIKVAPEGLRRTPRG